MIDITFARGTGRGSGPVGYVTSHGQIVAGDPDITERLIDSLTFKHKYTSGVLSWQSGETVTLEQEANVIAGWEKAHFAGLDSDRYNILWVRHTEANHHELHYVIPKVDLETGKRLNPKPPGKERVEMGDTFRRIQNLENGWCDPTDLGRRVLSKTATNEELKSGFNKGAVKIREIVEKIIIDGILAGSIKNSADVQRTIENVGDGLFKKSRNRKNAMSFSHPDLKRNIKFSGAFYDEQFTVDRDVRIKLEEAKSRDPSSVRRDLEILHIRLSELTEKRAEYNRKTFGETSKNNSEYAARGAKKSVNLSAEYAEITTEKSIINENEPVENDVLSAPSLPDFMRSQLGSAAIQLKPAEKLSAAIQNAGSVLSETVEKNENKNIDVQRKTLRSDSSKPNNIREQLHASETVKGAENDGTRSEINSWFAEFEQTASRTSRANAESNKNLHESNEHINRASIKINKSNQRVRKISQRSNRRIENNANELEQFKTDINLVSFLYRNGYEKDEKNSCANSVVMIGNGSKLVVATSGQKGVYFDVNNDSNKGTVIDFLKNQGLNLGQIRQRLRPEIGLPDPEPAYYKPSPVKRDVANVIIEMSKTKPLFDANTYLKSRGIDRIDSRFDVNIDNKNNIIFRHNDPIKNETTGFEKKNQGFTGFSTGGKKGLFTTNNIKTAETVYICESAIDAMSLAKIESYEEAAAYVSIGGNMSSEQLDMLQYALADKYVVIALDNDAGGHKMSEKLKGLFLEDRVEIIFPEHEGDDWNKQLTTELENNAAEVAQMLQRARSDIESRTQLHDDQEAFGIDFD